VEQACSNIAMQRIVSNHTYIWLRVRARYEMGWESTEYWSTSILMWQFRLLHPDEHEGLQGTDRAITTCRLPLNRRKRNVSTYSLVPEHHVHLQGNYPHPPRTPTLWIDKHRTRAYPKARRTATST
jgi:hypothetical protein